MSGYHQFRPLFSLLVCIFLIGNTTTKVVDGFLDGSKFPGVVEPSDSVIIEGSTLSIKCTLTTYSATSLRSEALYFTSYYSGVLTTVNSTYYHIRNESTMEMVIPDVKRETGMTFKCFVRDSNFTAASDTLINRASVAVGEAPYPIENIRIVSENLNNMTVDWCPESFQEDPVNSTLSWQIENSSSEYSGTCTTWTDNERNCTCVFCSSPASGVCLGKEQTFYSYQKYRINITSTNRYGTTSAFVEVYTSPEIVKPGPVRELKVDSTTSRQINISWRTPELAHFALRFQISVNSRWGEKFVIDVGANMSWTLDKLIPHTNYTIAVRCRPVEGGYWSSDSYIFGVTLEDAPQVAPNVTIGSFRLSDCSDSCNVTIFPQPIDEILQNGVIIDYGISVKSGNYSQGQVFFASRSKTASSVISIPSNVNSWVELTARTKVGDSPPRYVYFPSYFHRLPNVRSQGLYAEYTDDRKTEIFFKWNYNEDVDNYTLMYCLGISNDQNNCQNFPRIIFIPGHQTNYTFSTEIRNLVYSLSANYRNGTNGLTPQWLCIYDYSGRPAKPKMLAPIPVSETSMKISWESLLCNSVNRVKVLKYFLSYAPNSTANAASAVSITLPANVSEYLITGLIPETPYKLTLYAESRSGPGPNTTEDIQTSLQRPVKIVGQIVASVIAVLIVVVLIIAVIFCVRKYRRWMYNSIKIKAPDTLVISEFTNDSSTVCDPYAIMTMNSDNPDGICSSSSTSNNPPILRICHSESCSSGASTETSMISSIDSIRTYTAIHNNEVSSATDYPSYSQATIPANQQLCEDCNSMPPRSTSFEQKLESFDSCGHGQDKLADETLDSDCLFSNSLYKPHSSSSVESLQSDDDYKKTELQDCFRQYELTGPPAAPQMM